MNCKKEDFFMSGAAQSAIIYNLYPALGGLRSLGEKDLTILVYINGVVSFYVGKKGITAYKNKLLKEKYSNLNERYLNWQKKWYAQEPKLFKIATSPLKDWRQTWAALDKISLEYWQDSYFLDCFDHFPEEFDNIIVQELQKHNFDPGLRGDLVLPAEATKVQQVDLDLHKVKEQKMSKEKFLRQYWYSHGSWNGGALLNLEKLNKDIEGLGEEMDFSGRQKIQQVIDAKLNPKVLNLVKILRLFALWRDDRKVFLQIFNLGYVNVVNHAAKELKLEPRIIEFALKEEIDQVKKDLDDFKQREKQSILKIKPGQFGCDIFINEQAEPYIKEFVKVEKTKTIKGTVACPGKVSGKVQVILRRHQFFEFAEGDILVTTMTRPEFIPLMKKAAAIITDEGGLTCHASIVSRELKKPCIVGAKDATLILKTGDSVEVDANLGIVKIIK